MEDSKQLARRFREVMLDGKWIANTNYKMQIIATPWKQADKKVASLNTVATLTFHLNYYIEGVLNVFKGGKLEIRDKYSFDAPAIKSKTDWDERIQAILVNSEEFAKHIEVMSSEQLEAAFVDEKYGTYRRNIEGMIEHAYYHLGQIVLIRKMLGEGVA